MGRMTHLGDAKRIAMRFGQNAKTVRDPRLGYIWRF